MALITAMTLVAAAVAAAVANVSIAAFSAIWKKLLVRALKVASAAAGPVAASAAAPAAATTGATRRSISGLTRSSTALAAPSVP